jgi:hypothetical protein
MKMNRTSIGIGLVLAGALTAVAWNSQEQDISKLGVDNIYNPAGTTVTVNDSLTVNGTLTASTITASATNITAGTVLNAVDGHNVTNLNGANIEAGNIDEARISNALVHATSVGDAGTIFTGDTFTAGGAITGSGGITIISGAYTGVLNIVSTTLTLVVNGTVTNVLDADITSE